MSPRPALTFLYPRGAPISARSLLKSNTPPSLCIRYASRMTKAEQRDKDQEASKKKKKRTTFINQPVKYIPRFSLLDAMRYIRAFEVGQDPRSAKYDLAVRLRSVKNGPIIRNRVQLPHVVDSSIRIAVICPPDSPIAKEAERTGAVMVGEESIFEAVKEGRINFNRCICHESSVDKLNKAGVAKILGPKGLMPSKRNGTMTSDVSATMSSLAGSSDYRERSATIRCAIGQLGFTPEEVQNNVKVFMSKIKEDCNRLSDKVSKDVHEVVLSSTHSPGFSLTGEFRSPESVSTQDLSVL